MWKDVVCMRKSNDEMAGSITTGSAFHKQLIDGGLMPFGGDHTRLVVTQFPSAHGFRHKLRFRS